MGRLLPLFVLSLGFACAASGPDTPAPKEPPPAAEKDHGTSTEPSPRRRAALAALHWLGRHQESDGSWSPDAFDARCGAARCGEAKGFGFPEYRVGTTALACLAFLGAGYDHRATREWTDPFTKKTIRAGEVVKRALTYLKEHQDGAGNFCETTNHKWGYNHGIATLAMAEAYGLTRAPQFATPAQRGLDALMAGQNALGESGEFLGWRYRPKGGDSDVSVTGWCFLALRAGQAAGLRVAPASLEGATRFCREVTDVTSGHLGYTKREEAGQQVKAVGKNEEFRNHPTFAAIGLCVRALGSAPADDPVSALSLDLLRKDLPDWDRARRANDYYYWYFGSLALAALGRPADLAADWRRAVDGALLPNQASAAGTCAEGSWAGDDRWGVDGGGRVFATALNALTCEVQRREPAPAPR